MPAKQLAHRRFPTTELATTTGVEGEFIMDTTKKTITVHDDLTPGGTALATSKDVTNASIYFADDTGSGSVADNYILTPNSNTSIPTSYENGIQLGFTTNNPNTGAAVANFAGIGELPIKLAGGIDPDAGDISGRVTLVVDAVNGWFELSVVESSLPRGYISGLTTAIDGGDTDHDVSVGAGTTTDTTNSLDMRLTGSLTKQIDAAWTAGDEAGGLASALTLSADTWYHMFVIGKTDGTTEAGWDTSINAVNLLADATDYIYFRRVASHLTDSGSNLTPYIQEGDYFEWAARAVDVFDASGGTAGTLATLSVPPNIDGSTAKLILSMTAGNSVYSWVKSTFANNSVPTGSNFDMLATATIQGVNTERNVLVDNSGQVRYRSSTSPTSGNISIQTIGWTDRRGE